MMSNGAWRDQLPEDLKDHDALTNFEKLGDFANAYIELGKSKGDLEQSKTDLEGKLAQAIQIPGEDASDEDRAAFLAKLGRPENPEGYELKRPDLPEGFKYNEDRENAFRKFAHDSGLTQAQASAIHSWFNEQMLKSYQDFASISESHLKEAEETLKKEWGDKFSENVEIAKRTAKTLDEKGLKGLGEWLEKSDQGNNPLVIKLFHMIGKHVLDDKTILGSLGGETGKSAAALLYPEMASGE